MIRRIIDSIKKKLRLKMTQEAYLAKCEEMEKRNKHLSVVKLTGKKIASIGGGPSEGGGVFISIIDEEGSEYHVWTDEYCCYCAGPIK